MRFNFAFALGLVSVLSIASSAHAEESPASPAGDARQNDLRVDMTVGPASDGTATIGTIALARFGLFEVGADATAGTQIFGYSYGTLSGVAGIGWQTSSGVRLDLLGELGATSYTAVGYQFLGGDGGVGGWTGTAGAKAGVSYVFFPRAKGHLVLGVWGYGGNDLSRHNVSERYTEDDGTDQGRLVTTTHTIGTARAGALFSIGGVFSL